MTLLRRDPQTRGNLEVYNSFQSPAKHLLGAGLFQALIGLGLGFRVLGGLFQCRNHRGPVIKPELRLRLRDDQISITLIVNTLA